MASSMCTASVASTLRVMLAQPVLVHGERALPGVVATRPPHMLTANDSKRYPPIDALVVDLGLPG